MSTSAVEHLNHDVEEKQEAGAGAEILPVDSGIIRCICGFDHDDGFTIQCEHCNAWQHALCVDIFDENQVPDVYLCNLCSERKVDPAAATERQLSRLRKRRRTQRRTSPPGEDMEFRRGNRKKKKRKDDEGADKPPDSHRAFYTPVSVIQTSPAARAYLRSIPPSESILCMPASEYLRLKPAPPHIVRHNWNCGLSAYSAVAVSPIARDRLAVEFLGDLVTLSEYKRNPVNQYRIWGSPKPGVVFVPDLALAVDGRGRGGPSTFVRRSRTPNLRVQALLVGDHIHIVGITTAAIKPGGELLLPWQWDAAHPIHLLSGQSFLKSELASLTKQQRMCLERLDEVLRDTRIGSLEECITPEKLPQVKFEENKDDFSELDFSVDTSVHISASENPIEFNGTAIDCGYAPNLRPATRYLALQKAFLADHNGRETATQTPAPERILEENIWVPAVAGGDAPAPRKKLSLADYKKKRL